MGLCMSHKSKKPKTIGKSTDGEVVGIEADPNVAEGLPAIKVDPPRQHSNGSPPILTRGPTSFPNINSPDESVGAAVHQNGVQSNGGLHNNTDDNDVDVDIDENIDSGRTPVSVDRTFYDNLNQKKQQQQQHKGVTNVERNIENVQHNVANNISQQNVANATQIQPDQQFNDERNVDDTEQQNSDDDDDIDDNYIRNIDIDNSLHVKGGDDDDDNDDVKFYSFKNRLQTKPGHIADDLPSDSNDAPDHQSSAYRSVIAVNGKNHIADFDDDDDDDVDDVDGVDDYCEIQKSTVANLKEVSGGANGEIYSKVQKRQTKSIDTKSGVILGTSAPVSNDLGSGNRINKPTQQTPEYGNVSAHLVNKPIPVPDTLAYNGGNTVPYSTNSTIGTKYKVGNGTMFDATLPNGTNGDIGSMKDEVHTRGAIGTKYGTTPSLDHTSFTENDDEGVSKTENYASAGSFGTKFGSSKNGTDIAAKIALFSGSTNDTSTAFRPEERHRDVIGTTNSVKPVKQPVDLPTLGTHAINGTRGFGTNVNYTRSKNDISFSQIGFGTEDGTRVQNGTSIPYHESNIEFGTSKFGTYVPNGSHEHFNGTSIPYYRPKNNVEVPIIGGYNTDNTDGSFVKTEPYHESNNKINGTAIGTNANKNSGTNFHSSTGFASKVAIFSCDNNGNTGTNCVEGSNNFENNAEYAYGNRAINNAESKVTGNGMYSTSIELPVGNRGKQIGTNGTINAKYSGIRPAQRENFGTENDAIIGYGTEFGNGTTKPAVSNGKLESVPNGFSKLTASGFKLGKNFPVARNVNLANHWTNHEDRAVEAKCDDATRERAKRSHGVANQADQQKVGNGIENYLIASPYLHSGPISTSGLNLQLPDRKIFRQQVIDAHNKYRAMHDAHPLRLSNVLNEQAQKWAEKGAKAGDLDRQPDDPKSPRFGENLWSMTASGPTAISGDYPVQTWYEESIFYDYKHPLYSGTNHFTQMVWKSTREIGVGVAVSPDERHVYVVCNYTPSGNIANGYRDNVLSLRP